MKNLDWRAVCKNITNPTLYGDLYCFFILMFHVLVPGLWKFVVTDAVGEAAFTANYNTLWQYKPVMKAACSSDVTTESQDLSTCVSLLDS
jgi:hypothetical protein